MNDLQKIRYTCKDYYKYINMSHTERNTRKRIKYLKKVTKILNNLSPSDLAIIIFNNSSQFLLSFKHMI